MSLGRIVLAPPERRELKRRARKRSLAVELVKRTEVILMLAPRVILTGKFGSNWIAVTSISGSGRGAFKKSVWPDWIRVIGGSQRRTRTAETEARILEATRQGPTDGTTHWSSYRLAKELGISQSSMSRVWRDFGIEPHRVRGYMASDDPEFEEQ